MRFPAKRSGRAKRSEKSDPNGFGAQVYEDAVSANEPSVDLKLGFWIGSWYSIIGMRAMILAAGLGTRLEPITKEIPKPLVPVLGVPNIVRIIRRLRHAGIFEIVINTHWLGEVLEAYLGNGRALGVEIAYSREEVLLGTGGGIKKALPLLGDKPFLVVNGDALFAPDFEQAALFHKASGAVATMVVRRDSEAEAYGAVGLDRDNVVRQLVWAGDASRAEARFMFTGMHVLEPEIGDRLPDKGCIVRETYIPMLEEGVPFIGLPEDGYFCDLGTPSRYLEANQKLARGDEILADVEAPESGVYIGKDVSLGMRCRLLPGTVIGDRVRVAPGTTLENTVVFEDAEVNEDLSSVIVTSKGTVVRA
jgi:mannose-1-phosphate guanylyltransferase